MKTLHLVLKSKWYDKIASGEKTSEYRECKPYWIKRLIGLDQRPNVKRNAWEPHCCDFSQENKWERVVFHKGYTATTMEFDINGLYLLFFTPNDLGLDVCWEIKLGQRIK